MAALSTEPSPGAQAPAPALRGPAARPASRLLHRRVWLRLTLLLSAPLAWMLVVYVVALAALLITSLWSVDSLTSEIDRSWTLDNFRTLVENEVYRTVAVRTVTVALAVTVIDVAIALPIGAILPWKRGRVGRVHLFGNVDHGLGPEGDVLGEAAVREDTYTRRQQPPRPPPRPRPLPPPGAHGDTHR